MEICVPHRGSAYTIHMYAGPHACKLDNMQLDETVTLPHQIWKNASASFAAVLLCLLCNSA